MSGAGISLPVMIGARGIIATVSVEADHQNHFHVYLRPLNALPIGDRRSLPLGTNETAQNSVDRNVAPDVSKLQEYLENHVMLPSIGPVLPPPEQTITISQAIAPIGQIASPEKTLTFCTYAESGSSDAGGNAYNDFGVIGREVAKYFGFNHQMFTVDEVMQYTSSLIAGPKHGTVERVGDPRYNTWEIKPTRDYVGADRAVFLVEAKGRKLKVVMEFQVVDFIQDPPKNEGMPPCRERSSAGAITAT